MYHFAPHWMYCEPFENIDKLWFQRNVKYRLVGPIRITVKFDWKLLMYILITEFNRKPLSSYRDGTSFLTSVCFYFVYV
jgi:hypothetical protein